MRLIPYRLPEWKDRETVYVVEGEKDVDTLWKSGIPATCNPMGAGKWRTEFNNLFAGKKVVILPDNDPQGEQHTRTVAVNLFPVAQAVKIVPLPNLPPKGDISDWIEDGGTREDLARIVKDTPTLPTDEIDGWKKPTYQTKRFSSLSEVRCLLRFHTCRWNGL